jgi:hypothetical protein
MWCAPLRHRDSHAGPVNLLCVGRCRFRSGDIAVVHLHECRTEGEVICAGGIARCDSHVPVIGHEAFVIASGIVVWLKLNWHAEMRGERLGNGNGHAAESAVEAAGHENRIGGDKGSAQFAGRRQCSGGRRHLRPCSGKRPGCGQRCDCDCNSLSPCPHDPPHCATICSDGSYSTCQTSQGCRRVREDGPILRRWPAR